MSRAKYKIEKKDDYRLAKAWLNTKISEFYFPYSSKYKDAIDRNFKAKSVRSLGCWEADPDHIHGKRRLTGWNWAG